MTTVKFLRNRPGLNNPLVYYAAGQVIDLPADAAATVVAEGSAVLANPPAAEPVAEGVFAPVEEAAEPEMELLAGRDFAEDEIAKSDVSVAAKQAPRNRKKK